MKNIWLNYNMTQTAHTIRYHKNIQDELDKNYSRWIADEKWESKLEDKHGKKTAMILENQRLFDIYDKSDYTEQAYEVCKNFIGFDLVSVTPMLGPGSDVFYTEKENPKLLSKQISATSRMIGGIKDPVSIAAYMNREIINDLFNNAGTVKHVSESSMNFESMTSHIHEVKDCIYRKTVRTGKSWLVASSEIADILGENFSDIGEFKKGRMKLEPDRAIFVDPLYTGKEILIGFQDDLLNGYFYNPYIMYSISGENFCTRRGKKLISNKAYGKIVYK